MTILMEAEAVGRGLADLADAAESLDSARARATQRVDALMASWRGDAAESFAAAYEEWAAAAADVRARLEALRIGVAQARDTLDGADADTATCVDRVSRVGQLAGRLG